MTDTEKSNKIPRIYIDTSVIGGCFDDEFADDSKRLVEGVKGEKFIALVSEIVLAELSDAPGEVKNILMSLPENMVEKVTVSEEIIGLRDKYIEANILGPKWIDDAAHVASATVAQADAIVSWNFKHIVRLDKMKAYNRVNLANGYDILTIVSPREVIIDEEE